MIKDRETPRRFCLQNMEHPATTLELRITGEMDFIVPLKQVGLITRAVLESIRLFHRPRRIIVVTTQTEREILLKLAPSWDVGPLECMDEESFFVPNFGLSMGDLLEQYDANRKGDQREPGWWIQQLIKLGAASQIPGISPVYVVWDGTYVYFLKLSGVWCVFVSVRVKSSILVFIFHVFNLLCLFIF